MPQWFRRITKQTRSHMYLGKAERAVLSALVFTLGMYSTSYSAPEWTDAQWQLHEIIQQHARIYGVNPDRMIRVATCESQMGAQPHGDRGHSHGPWQLNDRPTGLLWDFYARGYTDPYSYNQSTDYYARVLSGEWSAEGVTALRWSCR